MAAALAVAIVGGVVVVLVWPDRRDGTAATSSPMGGATAWTLGPPTSLPTADGQSGGPGPTFSIPPGTSTASVPPDFAAAVERVRPSVVRVVASTCQGTGVGTGFWVDPRTVATSYQSVARAVSVAVVDQSGAPVPARVVGADPATAVALLRVAGADAGAPVQFGAADPGLGDWIASVGIGSRRASVSSSVAQVSSTGIGLTHRQVRIDGLARVPGRVDIGLGGAPVVAADGAVVGAVFALPSRDQRLIVPATPLAQGIQRARGSGAPTAGDCALPTGPHSQTTISGAAPTAMRKGLDAYFGGINRADYAKAFNALGPAYHGPGSSLSKIAPGWVSTYDFNIAIRSTGQSGSSPRAWVTFDSIFARGRGPVTRYTCARWSLDYTFVQDGSRWEINGNRPHGGAKVSHRPC